MYCAAQVCKTIPETWIHGPLSMVFQKEEQAEYLPDHSICICIANVEDEASI